MTGDVRGPLAGAPAGLPDDVRELLAAVRDALDIPLPGLTDADERAHSMLLRQRRIIAAVALKAVLDVDCDPARQAAWLRGRIAETPVTYAVWVLPAERDGGAS